MISLARGTILLFDPMRREQTLAPKHGLSVYNWHQAFAGRPTDFGALTVKLEDSGTFPELLQVTGNHTLLRRTVSGRPHRAWRHTASTLDVKVTLEDIVSRVPDLQDQMYRWKKIRRCMWVSDYRILNEDEHGVATLNFLASNAEPLSVDEAIETFFSCLSSKQVHHQGGLVTISAPARSENWPPFWDMVITSRGAALDGTSMNVVKPFDNGFDCSKSAACFVLSYILGMFARYYPSRWMALTRNETGDAALPTLLAALDFIERDFPWMISDMVDSRIAASTA